MDLLDQWTDLENTTLTISPGYGSNNLKFQTIKSDIRKYWRFGRDYTFAIRGFLVRL